MSTTYISQYAVILGFILKFFKIEVSSEEVTSLVSAALVLGGTIWTLYKRHQQGDVTHLGKRI